jgi:hypothetical protein
MYRFMSEWTGAGVGAGVARIITITAVPITMAVTVADTAVMARGDNNKDKLPVSDSYNYI